MLRLQLLGGFRAYTEAGEVSALEKQPRRAALLTFLALERDAARERVIALLWPEADAERGRHSLNQGIYYLRQRLGPDWVELRGDRCVVAPWVVTDVQEIEAAAAARADEDVLRLYRGPLLAGTSWAATAEFDMWVDQRRAGLDRLHRGARRRQLAALVAAGRTQDALRCAEEWCRLDPLEDEAQHGYLQLLAETRQRSEALRQFAAYRRLLAEHELRPLAETVALMEQLQHGAPDLPRATRPDAPPALPVPATRAAVAPTAAPRPASRRPATGSALLHTRSGLAALLAAVFLFNWIETTAETWLAPRLPAVAGLRLQLARAAHWLEGHYIFEHHELTNRLAVVGYSTSYFILFPLLLLGVGVALARRPGIRPFRVFSLAVVVNYLISLPFFVFFPVPERWAYPAAEAMVLSDLWSARLIDLFRPFSGLDNSFPSVHVSLTVMLVLVAFAHRLRFRWSVLWLGATVVLATYTLGIHWISDLVAGAAAGVLSFALARRTDARLARAARPYQTAALRFTAAGLTDAAMVTTADRAAKEVQPT
jgi:DNA-binding SARP family transcriptional activator/membrane-associated phospholipid phosphatase